VEKLYGKTPPQHLKDIGVLDDRLTAAHCTYATEEDIELIKASGTGILHCRAAENPFTQWVAMGIPLGLGTDDYHHDMLTLLRQNLIGQRAVARRERAAGGATTEPLSYYDFLELATRRGAEVLGVDKEIGSLEPGKKADVITFNMLNPFLTPTKDPLTSIVLYGSSADIDTVIVDGNILKENGALTTMDLKESLLTAQVTVEKIIDRFFREHPEQKTRWEQKVPYMK
jgi:5-methylthioadenosine/S-adenosylhomocysteine deaminase